MNRFVGWLGRRGAAASALGVAAALAGEALAESRKKGGNGGERENREDREERQDDEESRDSKRNSRKDEAQEEQEERGARSERRNRTADDDDADDDGAGRGGRRGKASSEQKADEDDGEAEALQTTPTPTPTAVPGAPTLPTPPAIGETNASIEDAQGNVIVGFDPESGSVVATSGNVSAISGPGGPTVIINDDEAVAPVPDEGVTPNPDGGDPNTDFAS